MGTVIGGFGTKGFTNFFEKMRMVSNGGLTIEVGTIKKGSKMGEVSFKIL